MGWECIPHPTIVAATAAFGEFAAAVGNAFAASDNASVAIVKAAIPGCVRVHCVRQRFHRDRGLALSRSPTCPQRSREDPRQSLPCPSRSSDRRSRSQNTPSLFVRLTKYSRSVPQRSTDQQLSETQVFTRRGDVGYRCRRRWVTVPDMTCLGAADGGSRPSANASWHRLFRDGVPTMSRATRSDVACLPQSGLLSHSVTTGLPPSDDGSRLRR